jgi:hypothetical protein
LSIKLLDKVSKHELRISKLIADKKVEGAMVLAHSKAISSFGAYKSAMRQEEKRPHPTTINIQEQVHRIKQSMAMVNLVRKPTNQLISSVCRLLSGGAEKRLL